MSGTALLYGFGPGGRKAVFYAIATIVLYAVTDEIHQVFIQGRHAGVNDVLIDVGAACIAILLYEMIRRFRYRRTSLS